MLGEYGIMNTATKINPEGFIEMVEELSKCDSPNRKQLDGLVGAFKEVATFAMQLQILTNNGQGESADAVRLMKKLEELQTVVKESFKQFCESNGKTVEEALQFVEDPQNYSQKEWEEAQALRRKIEEKATYSAPSGIDWAQPKIKRSKREGK